LLRVVFRILTRIMLALMVILSVTIGLVYFFPEMLLNPGTLRLALGSKPMLTWEGAEIQFEAAGFLKKRMHVQLLKPCIDLQDGKVTGCFESFQLRARVGLQNFRPYVFELGPVQAKRGDLKVHIQEPEPSREPEGEAQPWGWVSQVAALLNEKRIHDLQIDLTHFQVTGPDLNWEGQIELNQRLLAKTTALRIQGHASELSTAQNLRVNGTIRPEPPSGLAHEIALTFRDGAVQLQLQERGVLKTDLISAIATGNLSGLAREVPKVSFKTCEVRSKLGSLSTTCPFETQLKVPGIDIRKITALLNAEIKTESLIPSFEALAPARVKLSAQIPNSGLEKLNGSWEGQASLSSFSGRFKIDFLADHFTRLLRSTLGSRTTLPAPFSVLDGRIEFSSVGNLDSSRVEADSRAVFNLHSPTQRLNFDLDANSNTIFGKASRVKAQVFLRSVDLELPNLDYLKLPRLTKDSRIFPQKANARPGQPLTYDAEIRTESGAPVRLFGKQVTQGIPVVLDLSFASERALSGTVGVRSFPLQAFRRKATVEYFRITLKDVLDDSLIEGRLIFPSTEYTIDVGVFGTMSRPQIRLSSDPPIPEEKLMAVLVFGVPFENLDADQTASIASTKAALTDGVLGLASLFALSSTPIERIGYDPGSGAASIRLKVGKGASITVQSRAEETDVALRKRIGANWVISTDLSSLSRSTTDPGLTGQQSTILSTFLEWNYRY